MEKVRKRCLTPLISFGYRDKTIMNSIKKLTRKELTEIVRCYANVFPEWKIVGGNRLVRTNAIILQQIGFESLRYGAYRPVALIQVLPLPFLSMLHQELDIKHREIERREHPLMWQKVVAAMEQQFQPSIRKPLDLREVRDLCEQANKVIAESRGRECIYNLCMLSILNAYLGEREQALSYCQQMKDVPPPDSRTLFDWEISCLEFGNKLHKAIENGNERQFLDTVASEN